MALCRPGMSRPERGPWGAGPRGLRLRASGRPPPKRGGGSAPRAALWLRQKGRAQSPDGEAPGRGQGCCTGQRLAPLGPPAASTSSCEVGLGGHERARAGPRPLLAAIVSKSRQLQRRCRVPSTAAAAGAARAGYGTVPASNARWRTVPSFQQACEPQRGLGTLRERCSGGLPLAGNTSFCRSFALLLLLLLLVLLVLVLVLVVVVVVVGCWLLVVGCWLLVVGCCWLLVVGCWLLVVGCWLLVVGCWLLVVGCWLLLFVVCCLLFVVCCLLFVVVVLLLL